MDRQKIERSKGTTFDMIYRQQAIDALNEYFARIGKLERGGLTEGEKAISLDTVGIIKTLPSVQPKPSISLSWIDEHIEWLKSCDNEFANLAAAHISVMVKKWRRECHDYYTTSPYEMKFCPNCGADMRSEQE